MCCGPTTDSWCKDQTVEHHLMDCRTDNQKAIPISETNAWKMLGPSGTKFESAQKCGLHSDRQPNTRNSGNNEEP